jgi:hypothetical protein
MTECILRSFIICIIILFYLLLYQQLEQQRSKKYHHLCSFQKYGNGFVCIESNDKTKQTLDATLRFGGEDKDDCQEGTKNKLGGLLLQILQDLFQVLPSHRQVLILQQPY